MIGTKCLTCNSVYYPPKTLCPNCRSKGKLEEIQLSGKGKIISYTVIRAPPEGFEKYAPYVIAIIQLDEGPKISGQIVDDTERIEPGKKVVPVFRKIYEDGEDGIIHYGIKWKIEE
jgi:hypothetical protein